MCHATGANFEFWLECLVRTNSEGPIRRPERGRSEWEPIKILLEGD
jgi:hypothetical protein